MRSLFGFLFTSPAADAAPSAASIPDGWTGCPDCGLMQILPAPRAGLDRQCSRCGFSFGSGVVDIEALFALSACMPLFFIAANTLPLLGIFIESRHATVTIADASDGLLLRHNLPMSMFVFGLTILMPLAHMTSQCAVMFCLWRGFHPGWLAHLHLVSERVRPWAMLDVFMLATFITLSKLRNMSQVQLLPGIWILGMLIALFVAFGLAVDRRKIWDLILPPPKAGSAPQNTDWIECVACGLPHVASKNVGRIRCDRCASILHPRKPDSVTRTWALVLASLVLYIPANLYPVMTIINLGRERPTTIIEGVRDLWNGSDWPYAFLIFAASIIIPLFKLIGLSGFLLTYHWRNRQALMYCTRFYRLFDRIGRWSMLDIFVAALLGALVSFGNFASIIPGPGLLPFALVVVLTITALASFDPRLIWDAAGANDER